MGEGDELVGQTLAGKYRVVRRLGAGGLGSVFEVEHLLTHNRHALKVLHRRHAMDADAVSRLVREAGISGRVGSPRLVATHDVGQLEDGRNFLLMELLEGRTWRERLTSQRTLHPSEAVRLARQVCEGLAAAHAAGVVHRDLKPSNVFLVGAQGDEEVKLLDFGLAKNLPGHTDQFGALTVAGGLMGTPQYLSPEQGMGERVDGRTDQYAVAVMLYESLTGEPPFVGAGVADVIARIHEGSYTPIGELAPHLPPALVAVVQRGMSRDAEARFGSIEAFADALAPFAGSVDAMGRTDAFPSPLAAERTVPATRPPPAMPTASPAPRARSRLPWVVLGGGLAALLGVGAFLGWRLLAREVQMSPSLVAPAPEPGAPADTAPEPAAPTPPEPRAGWEDDIAPRLHPIARTLPAAIAGLTPEYGPRQSRIGGFDAVEQAFAGPTPGGSAIMGIYDGFDASELVRNTSQPYRSASGFLRQTTVRGVPVHYSYSRYRGPEGLTHSGSAEAVIGERYRVSVAVLGVDDDQAALRYLRAFDLEALQRLAAQSAGRR